MAKFVVAGKSNCPFYAKAELLADYLALNLPDFRVHKIVLKPEEWKQWLNKTCEERSFKHSSSPLIWRELIDRGGKGLYVGGCDDFLELVNAFYMKVSEKLSEELLCISQENLQTKIEVDEELEEEEKEVNPLKIAITGAATPIAYGVFNAIGKGEIFGDEEEVSIQMLDNSDDQEVLAGVAMELQDCAWPLLRDVQTTDERSVAFKDASLVVLLDSLSFQEGKDKMEYIKENAKIFKLHAEAIELHVKKDAKILVVGGPANINAAVVKTFAPSIPQQNICALSRFQECKAKSMLAKKLNVNAASIKDVIVWGNISFNQVVDASKSRVHGFDGAIWAPHLSDFTRSVPEMIHDEKWLTGDFVNNLTKQEEAFRIVYNKCGSMSMSNAITTQLQHWIQGSPVGEYFSLGVVSEGWYDIPEGVVISLPVKFSEGKWEVVEGLSLDDEIKNKMQEIVKEIQKETDEVIKSFDEPPINEPTTLDEGAEEKEKVTETLEKKFGEALNIEKEKEQSEVVKSTYEILVNEQKSDEGKTTEEKGHKEKDEVVKSSDEIPEQNSVEAINAEEEKVV